MAKSVELTKQHLQALKREAGRFIDAAEEDEASGPVGELFVQIRRGLARFAAAGEREDPLIRLELSDAQVDWAIRMRQETELHLRELARTSREGGYNYQCKESFLVRVLDHVLNGAS